MDIYGKSLGMIHEIGRLPHNPHIFTSPNFHSNLLQSAGRTCTNRMPKTYLQLLFNANPCKTRELCGTFQQASKRTSLGFFSKHLLFLNRICPLKKNVMAHHPPQRNICTAVPSSRSSYPVSEGSGLVKVPFLQH